MNISSPHDVMIVLSKDIKALIAVGMVIVEGLPNPLSAKVCRLARVRRW